MKIKDDKFCHAASFDQSLGNKSRFVDGVYMIPTTSYRPFLKHGRISAGACNPLRGQLGGLSSAIITTKEKQKPLMRRVLH